MECTNNLCQIACHILVDEWSAYVTILKTDEATNVNHIQYLRCLYS